MQSTPVVDLEMGVDVNSSSAQRQGFYLQGGNPPIQVDIGADGLVDITAQVLGPDDDGFEGSFLEDAGDLGLLSSCLQGEM